jgi:nuclear GTP-binding protein
MVKKKGKSKRTTLKDKYKIQRRITETHRKQKKQIKKDKINGVVRNSHISKKDPGIPNSWPFKQDLLKEIQKTREQQKQLQQNEKSKRKQDLQALREHQESGGAARTVQEMMEQARAKQANFEFKTVEKEMSDGAVAAGQQSRRAYLRELKKVIDTADVLLQVLDARDPLASRIHPSIEDAILSRSDKRMVFVLNKIDLVPREVVGAWLTALRRSRPTIAIKGNSLERRSEASGKDDDMASVATTGASSIGADGLLQLLKNYARTGSSGGKSKTTIVVGVIGYPNVG